MNARLTWMGGVVVVLIGATAWLLAHLESIQRVGVPGVKVVPMPVRSASGTLIGTNGVDLPASIPGFTSTRLDIAQTVLDLLPADTLYGSRRYQTDDGFWADMNVVLMGRDRTSIHKPEYCLTGVGWVIDEASTTSVHIPGPAGYDLPVMRMLVTRTENYSGGPPVKWRGIYVFWFVADGQLTARHNQRMWWMARDLLTRGLLQRWAYVSCFTVCRPGQEQAAYERLAGLVASAAPEFQLTTPASVGLRSSSQPEQWAQNLKCWQ